MSWWYILTIRKVKEVIFVTVGSQKFQFDRLLKEIDRLIDEGIIKEEVFAQTGCSNYIPKNFAYKNFINREEFKKNFGHV